MEHLALGLVWLLGTVASVSPVAKQVRIVEKALDMAPNSFDDQYKGCSDQMEAKLQELNRTEFESNSIYAEAWKKASAEFQRHRLPSSVLKPLQAIALLAYTVESPPMRQKFNEDVGEAGCSREEYLLSFHFKVLHFLLTQAIGALRHAQPRRCYNVYSVVQDIIFTAQPGEIVRFGKFAESALNKEHTEGFGDGTIFSVKTCYGVPIRGGSEELSGEGVIIPPFETFEVVSVTRKGNTAHIELHSKDVYSKYNCEFVKAAPDCPSLASPGQSVTMLPLWGLVLAVTALA
ncbi:NARE ribosyltransferase, partial [Zapornia atra]|nr:NARE ribosyltransferase [Zapornia atra]